MTGTVRGAAARGDVQIVHTPVILRTSAKSSAPTVAPIGTTNLVSPVGDTDVQVGQVVATDHLTLPGSGNRGLDLLGSQEILRTSAESPVGGTQIVGTPGGDQHLEVRWIAPTVVDGQIECHSTYVSPLDADEHGRFPTALRGGPVHDVDEVTQIRARVAHAQRAERRRTTIRRWWGWRR